MTRYVRHARLRTGHRFAAHGLRPWGLLVTEDGMTGDRRGVLIYPWPGWGLVLEWGDLSSHNF